MSKAGKKAPRKAAKKAAKRPAKKAPRKAGPKPKTGRPRRAEAKKLAEADAVAGAELEALTPLTRLRPAEQAFVLAYTSDPATAGDKSASARAAGYSPGGSIYDLMHRPRVKAAIAYVQRLEAEERIASREQVLAEMSLILTGRHPDRSDDQPIGWRDRIGAGNLISRMQGWTSVRHLHSAEGAVAEALTGLYSELTGALAATRKSQEAEARRLESGDDRSADVVDGEVEDD